MLYCGGSRRGRFLIELREVVQSRGDRRSRVDAIVEEMQSLAYDALSGNSGGHRWKLVRKRSRMPWR